MGMSVADFDELTPSELSAIVRVYAKKQERQSRQSWTISRFVATFFLLPYSKKRLKPKDLCVFEWEDEDEKSSPQASVEEIRERYRKVAQRFFNV